MLRAVALATLFLVTGCSTHSKNLTTDAGTMAEGNRLKDDEFYEEARNQYTRIKTEFPESPLQVEADLKIAETYFLEESYPAAASAYEEFIRTYPGRPELPMALYQLGMSHVNQMPSTPQRDTRSTVRTIDVFTRLLVDFPNSEYTADAKKYMSEARHQLSEKIFEIAKFYERTNQPLAAARRFGELIDQYPDTSHLEEAMASQVRNLKLAGETAAAEPLERAFQEKFPNSEFKSMMSP